MCFEEIRKNKGAVFFIIFAFLLILLFYSAYDKNSASFSAEKLTKSISFSNMNESFKELNRVTALAGLALVSIAFLIGPLSKIFPSRFQKFLAWRKLIGRAGLVLVIWHAFYSFFDFYSADIGKAFAENNALATIPAALGLLIFLMMSITSNDDFVKRIGYENWKKLQTIGYLGLFFAIMHFAVNSMRPDKVFYMKPSEIFIFSLAVFALSIRIVTIFIKLPERKKFEEHFGKT
jgi:DMSO/TMAO reductase YedYZ heme-binding membrane subunit